MRRSKRCCPWRFRRRKKQGKYVGICGQGPSDHQDFAAWLMEQGIDSLSLNPDTVVETWLSLAALNKPA
ncbi:putative PEP-binding protein [Pantoea ananatis]